VYSSRGRPGQGSRRDHADHHPDWLDATPSAITPSARRRSIVSAA
jgi:hypothetical protein